MGVGIRKGLGGRVRDEIVAAERELGCRERVRRPSAAC